MFPTRLSVCSLLASVLLSAQVPALEPADLSQMLKAGTWTVIEFGGPTCANCKRMQPILAELQVHFGARAQVRNFYVTEHVKEAQAFKIMAMPTQVLFNPSGQEVARHIGFWEKGDFLAALGKAGLK